MADDRNAVYRRAVADAMKEWAAGHPEADTQGIMDEDWLALADIAVQRTMMFVVEAVVLGKV